jgi:hypothetical protein
LLILFLPDTIISTAAPPLMPGEAGELEEVASRKREASRRRRGASIDEEEDEEEEEMEPSLGE